jgi:hypothetical protein
MRDLLGLGFERSRRYGAPRAASSPALLIAGSAWRVIAGE